MKATFQALKVQVPAGVELFFPAPGTMLQVKEADFSFELGLDDGALFPWDLGMGLACDPGQSFSQIRIKNLGPTTASYIIIYGNGRVFDDRINIVESRNGSAASNTPPGLSEFVSQADDGPLNTWVLLAPYDENRVSLELWTDAGAAAYWGLSEASALEESRNLAVTPGQKKLRRLETKAAIYVQHTEAGTRISALATNF